MPEPPTPNTPNTFTNLSVGATDYFWDFGDGATSNEADPVHTFPGAGEYVVLLTASNNCGFNLYTLLITIQGAPAAAFTADQQLGCAPLTVQFTGQASADITGYNWVFPGGTPATSTDPQPTVVYETAGAYAVELTVEGPGGTGQLVEPDYITVGGAPVAGFSYVPDSLTVQFTNTSQGAGTFIWNFGDATIATDMHPVHTYDAAGEYIVTLTAQNDCGQTTFTQTVTISSATATPLLADSQVRITPNPANEHIRVEIDLATENPNVTVTLLDGAGRQVLSEQLSRVRQGAVSLPVRQLPAGAYQVWVRSEEGVAMRKVQVQH